MPCLIKLMVHKLMVSSAYYEIENSYSTKLTLIYEIEGTKFICFVNNSFLLIG